MIIILSCLFITLAIKSLVMGLASPLAKNKKKLL